MTANWVKEMNPHAVKCKSCGHIDIDNRETCPVCLAPLPVSAFKPKNQTEYPHYFKRVPYGETHVDVYWVLDAWEVTSQPIGHAIKKLLCAGKRGSKNRNQDLKEAAQSIARALELENPLSVYQPQTQVTSSVPQEPVPGSRGTQPSKGPKVTQDT